MSALGIIDFLADSLTKSFSSEEYVAFQVLYCYGKNYAWYDIDIASDVSAVDS